MEEEAKSSSDPRVESHVSRGWRDYFPMRLIVGVLVISHLIYIPAIAVQFHMLSSLKEEVNQLKLVSTFRSSATEALKSPISNSSGEIPNKNALSKSTPATDRPVKPSNSPRRTDEHGRYSNRWKTPQSVSVLV